MAATKQPGFKAGASAASALDDSAPPTSGAERIDTIIAKRKLSMRGRPTSPKSTSTSGQKSFATAKPPTSKSSPYAKKLGR